MTGKPASGSGEANDIGERLRRLQKLGVHKGRAGVKPVEQPVPPEVTPQAGALRSVEELAGSQLVQTPYGPCVVVERRYELEETRGGWPLAAAPRVSGAAVAACARDDGYQSFELGRAAFLDTETTGLGGGAGTLAFMVGIGTFEAGEPGPAYVVRQVFMRHPGEERALLYITGELLAGNVGLVSFNGRAFDAPLLATRFAMHRLPSPLPTGHLDLLPAARQRWRLRLPSCAMQALERDILAFQRSAEDVPGWLIPSLYQEFARGGGNPTAEAVHGIGQVFYHNREDVVTMVPLAAMLCTPFEDQGRLLHRQALHPIDYVTLGRSFEALGWLPEGEAAYRQALAAPLPEHVRCLALGRLGWLLKRQERRAEAVAVWQDWITSVPGHDPTPYEELAKY